MEAFEISSDQARHLRTGGQRLDQPGARAELVGVVGSVCGVNAQRTSAMLLSLRSRIHGLEASDVDQALLENRSLVRTWAMRGTLHLLRTEDAVWMIPLLGPVFLASGRRREERAGAERRDHGAGTRADPAGPGRQGRVDPLGAGGRTGRAGPGDREERAGRRPPRPACRPEGIALPGAGSPQRRSHLRFVRGMDRCKAGRARRFPSRAPGSTISRGIWTGGPQGFRGMVGSAHGRRPEGMGTGRRSRPPDRGESGKPCHVVG